MKRLLTIAITCIVVDQLKAPVGWLTRCKGIDGDGQVIFEGKIPKDKTVYYRPYIVPSDEFIHGYVLEVGPTPPDAMPVAVSSDVGKNPE